MSDTTAYLGLRLGGPFNSEKTPEGCMEWTCDTNTAILDDWCAQIAEAVKALGGSVGAESITIDLGTF